MIRDEVIEATMLQMRQAGGLLAGEAGEPGGSDRYEDVVITTLNERLPSGDLRVCQDFGHLVIDCCDVCHTQYAHYDMYIEQMSDGQHAWICCAIRSALRAEEAKC